MIKSDHIKMIAVTWNLQGKIPTLAALDALFQKDDVEHDMYVLGSQEAVRPIAQSMIFASKEKLNALIMEYFNPPGLESKYVMINSITLAATHLTVIVRKTLAPYLSDIKNDVLAIGFGDKLSNKGSVCLSFKLG